MIDRRVLSAALRIALLAACTASAALMAQTRPATATPRETQQPPSTETPAPAAQAPSFRVGIELVSLNVTVTDGSGRYVKDLAAADFSVYEDGVKQEVTYFSRTNLPIAL